MLKTAISRSALSARLASSSGRAGGRIWAPVAAAAPRAFASGPVEPAQSEAEAPSAPVAAAKRPEGVQESTVFEYVGPFGQAARRVKRLSLASCAAALASAPVIVVMGEGLGSHASTPLARLSIAGTLATFGVFTTGLMHWFTSPYVQRLRYYPATERVEVDSLDLLGRMKTVAFPLSSIEEPDSVHPLSSFKVNGKIYYVDPDNFGNDDLLLKLVPGLAQQRADMAEAERKAAENKED